MASRRTPGPQRYARTAMGELARVLGRFRADRDRGVAVLRRVLAVQTRDQDLSDARQNVDGWNSTVRFADVGFVVP